MLYLDSNHFISCASFIHVLLSQFLVCQPVVCAGQSVRDIGFVPGGTTAPHAAGRRVKNKPRGPALPLFFFCDNLYSISRTCLMTRLSRMPIPGWGNHKLCTIGTISLLRST
jgi:hypothetical protein